MHRSICTLPSEDTYIIVHSHWRVWRYESWRAHIMKFIHMLHLISSIQMPKYLAHCCTSNNIQYAQVVPPEAEKHTSPYILYGVPLTKNSKFELRLVQTWIGLFNCTLTAYPQELAHSKPTCTSCGLLNVNGPYRLLLLQVNEKTCAFQLFQPPNADALSRYGFSHVNEDQSLSMQWCIVPNQDTFTRLLLFTH